MTRKLRKGSGLGHPFRTSGKLEGYIEIPADNVVIVNMKFLIIVLTVIGLSFAAGFALTYYAFENHKHRNIDQKRLTRFANDLAESLNDPKKRAKLAAIPAQASARELFVQMYDHGVISLHNMHMLSGASGQEAKDDVYILENSEELTLDNIIFTSALSGQALLDLLEGRSKGVAMAFNHRYIGRYPEDGLVALFAGERKAVTIKWEDLDEELEERGLKPLDQTISDFSKVYGEHPFQHIAPE